MKNILIIGISLSVLLILLISTFVILFLKKKMRGLLTILLSLAAAVVIVPTFVLLSLSEQPVLNLCGEKDMVIPVFSEYVEQGATASFRDKDLTDKITLTGGVDTSTVGKYNVEYEFTYRGKSYKIKRKINVVDTVKPEINLTGETDLTLSSIDFFSESGFAATDNYDGDLTSSVQVNKSPNGKNQYKILYTVSDASGNTAKAERNITIKDVVKPVLKSDKGDYINIELGSQFSSPKITATDDLDGDISARIESQGSVNTSSAGIYKLEYSVTDKAGNKATLTVQVYVYVPDDPSLSRIYLTFDDGPSTNVTPRILDILRDNNIKATFFINGYSEDKLPIVRRIIDEGHTLAIHGMSHDYASIYSSGWNCINNINSLRDTVYNQTGYWCNIMRFPGGSSNNVSKQYCKGVISYSAPRLLAEGWRYFDWNVDSGDADGKMGSGYIINKVKNGLKKGRANVVLMHDHSSKSTTADALQEIINYGNQNGYIFSRIDENTPDVRHTIAN